MSDWETLYTADGDQYYSNKRTGAAQWEKPNEMKTETDLVEETGDWVWLKHPEDAFVPVKIVKSMAGNNFQVKKSEGAVFNARGDELGDRIANMTRLKQLPDDFVQLDDVNDASIVHTLRQRFLQDRIYTNIGDILVSVNPFKLLPLYTPMVMQEYLNSDYFDLKPHVFGISSLSYKKLMESSGVEGRSSQAILISGESGAGKTEATKLCLAFLSEAAGSMTGVEQKILAANPMLEAFGNAKTLRNDNSSRFGKFMELFFDGRGTISGCSTTNYLLEKSRLTTPGPGERTFHIFYQLCAAYVEEKLSGGAATAVTQTRAQKSKGGKRRSVTAYTSSTSDSNENLTLSKFGLGPAEEFDVLVQSGCLQINGLEDGYEFNNTRAAMDHLGFSKPEMMNAFNVCAASLHLGNLRFGDVIDDRGVEGSEVDHSDRVRESLDKAAELLRIESDDLQQKLRTRELIVRGETSLIQNKAFQAQDTRDALCKAVYSRTFDWLVLRLNEFMSNITDRSRSIGILDIFGFEIFQVNSFEQFCINFANEKLQQHFNMHTFRTEEETYTREGIPFDPVPYIDNQDVLDMVERKPGGILIIMDDEINVPRSTDLTFLQKVVQEHSRNPRFGVPRGEEGRSGFMVNHYAGGVVYNVSGFLDKNKDKLSDDLLRLMAQSKSPFISQVLFPPSLDDSRRGKQLTQSGKFKKQLDDLMATLNSSDPFYIRCIKPNMEKVPNKYNGSQCYHQLQCSGVFEAVTIRKCGYPFRLPHKSFYRRFRPLVKKTIREDKPRDLLGGCRKLIEALASLEGLQSSRDIRLGTTMVFWRSAQDKPLSALRALLANNMALKIQHRTRGFLSKRLLQFLKRLKVSLLQAARSDDLRVIDAALEQSNQARFKIKEHFVLEKHREVIIETNMVKEELKKLSNRTVDQIDDHFEEIIKAAKRLNVNTPEAQRCRNLYKEVEEKRDAVAALRDAVKGESISSNAIQQAIKRAEALKPKYGQNFCAKEEAEARKMLEHIRKEEAIIAEIDRELRSGAPTSTQDSDRFSSTIERGKALGCVTLKGQTVLQIADVTVDFRCSYADAVSGCMSGMHSIVAEVESSSKSFSPTSAMGLGMGSMSDVWTETSNFIDEALKSARDLSPGDFPELLQLKDLLIQELHSAQIVISQYRDLKHSLKVSLKSVDINELSQTEYQIMEFHGFAQIELFGNELQFVQLVIQELRIEEELRNELFHYWQNERIPPTPKGKNFPDIDQISTENMDAAVERASASKIRNPETAAMLKFCIYASKLRQTCKLAVAVSNQPKNKKDFVACKNAWEKVEAVLVEVSFLSSLPNWDDVESDIVRDLLTNQSIVQDIKDKLVEAIQNNQEEWLAFGLEQADKLGLDSHPEEEIRRVVAFARQRFEILNKCRTALESALKSDRVDVNLLRSAVFLANSHNYQHPLRGEAIEVLITCEVLVRKAHAAWQTTDPGEMARILAECDQARMKNDDTELLRSLVGSNDEKKFFQKLLKLNMFLKRMNIVTDVSVQIRDVFFRSCGEMFAMRNFPNFRDAEDYSRSGSAFGFANKQLAIGMLSFSSNVILTSLTKLRGTRENSDILRTSIAAFECIMGYMGDRSYSYPTMLAKEILQIGGTSEELKDEIYCQLVKQLTDNPNPVSRMKGFDLFNILLRSCSPSEALSSYVEYFLRTNNENALVRQLHLTTAEQQGKQMTTAEIGKAVGMEVCTSWLQVTERGRLYGSTKRKWFMLEDINMRYFNQERSLEAEIGHYDISQVNQVAAKPAEDNPSKSCFPFHLQFDNDELRFAAETREERDNWVKAINRAKKAYWDRALSTRI